jgi:hypothetical protein
MERAALRFDQEVIEDAVGRIQNATAYVGRLDGNLPRDLVGLSLLRQQAEELRKGLIVLTGLADALQHLYDQQAARQPMAAARTGLRQKVR